MKRKYPNSFMKDLLKNKHRIMQFNASYTSMNCKLILAETQAENEASLIDLTSAPRKIDLADEVFSLAPKKRFIKCARKKLDSSRPSLKTDEL